MTRAQYLKAKQLSAIEPYLNELLDLLRYETNQEERLFIEDEIIFTLKQMEE